MILVPFPPRAGLRLHMGNGVSPPLAFVSSYLSLLRQVDLFGFSVELPCPAILKSLKRYFREASLVLYFFKLVLMVSLRVFLCSVLLFVDDLALNVSGAKLSCMERQLHLFVNNVTVV